MKHFSEIEPSVDLKRIISTTEGEPVPQCICKAGVPLASCPYMTPREWRAVLQRRKEDEEYERLTD